MVLLIKVESVYASINKCLELKYAENECFPEEASPLETSGLLLVTITHTKKPVNKQQFYFTLCVCCIDLKLYIIGNSKQPKNYRSRAVFYLCLSVRR